MNTIESSSGDSGRKPPVSLRHGDIGTSSAASITTVTSTSAPTASLSPRLLLRWSASVVSAGATSSRVVEPVETSSSATSSRGTSSRCIRGSSTLSMMKPAIAESTSDDTMLK